MKPGYIAVYKEGLDDASDDDNDRILPAMEVGDELKLLAFAPSSISPSRRRAISEASLVKALEEYGIGRPSTYASIIQTLLDKKYTELVNKRFMPTDLGKIVNRFLTRNFEHYVDYGFTAKMEDELDEIADGKEDWVPVLDRFWKDFKQQVDDRRRDRDARRRRRKRASSASIPRPASRSRCAMASTARSCRSAPRTTKRSRSSRACARTSAWTRSRCRSARAVQAAAHARHMPDGKPIKVAIGRFGPYVQYGDEEIRFDQGRRSVHGRTAARAGADSREGRARRESHHPGFPGSRHPGAERPLRPVHHRSREERQDSQGSRADVADARRMQELIAAAPVRGKVASAQRSCGEDGRSAAAAAPAKQQAEHLLKAAAKAAKSRQRTSRRKQPPAKALPAKAAAKAGCEEQPRRRKAAAS